MNDDERQRAGALVLWFVAMCNGTGSGANGQTGVEGIRVFPAAVAIRGSGIEGASGIDDVGGIGGVVAAAAAAAVVGGAGINVAGASGIDNVGNIV